MEAKTPTTRLGHAVSPAANAASKPARNHEPHARTNPLRDVILGGQDGLVNMLGIALGVIAAGGSNHVLIAAGLAAAITESISMGAVAYTSFGTERDYYLAEQARERAEIESLPDVERREVKEIYAGKGFEGALLEDVVNTITTNRDVWVNAMMEEELHLQPAANSSIIRSAVIVTMATLIGHLIPLFPFAVVPRTEAVILAVSLSGIVLFAIGVYSAITLVGNWLQSGLRMVAIGLGAAGLGFLIGLVFHTSGA